MGLVPTIARPASRSVLYQFDGMTPPDNSPCIEIGEGRDDPLFGSYSRCRGE